MIEIIINSKNKKALKELEKIKKELEKNNLQYKMLFTDENKNAGTLMKEVISKELVVIGGDGTINEVINNYHDEIIIYIAGGSGNDLYKSLNLKENTQNIKELIDSLNCESYDVGEVNSRKFCSGFDIGFNADVIARVNRSKLKKYFGKYIYIEKGVVSLLNLKKYYAKIEWESEMLETNSLLLLNVMVQSYEGGGIKFSENACGYGGEFHIMIFENMSMWKFIYNYICLLLKKHENLRGVRFVKTDKLIVTTNQGYYQIDGELIGNMEKLSLKCIDNYYNIKRKRD